jgi:hypothetical protein
MSQFNEHTESPEVSSSSVPPPDHAGTFANLLTQALADITELPPPFSEGYESAEEDLDDLEITSFPSPPPPPEQEEEEEEEEEGAYRELGDQEYAEIQHVFSRDTNLFPFPSKEKLHHRRPPVMTAAAAAAARDHLNLVIRRNIRRALTPKRILFRDKIAFVLGLTDLWLSAYWLGSSPSSFSSFYSYKIIILLILRWCIYRSKRWHYYLFDFCYYAQGLQLLQLWGSNLPSFFSVSYSITMTKLAYSISHGPLLWSIVAFRNSLVLHSLDKTTSHFLHFSPGLIMYSQRWQQPLPPLAAHLDTDPQAFLQWQRANPWELVILPMLFYLSWAFLYYLKVFIVSSKKIQKKNYETLFKYVTRSRKSLFGSVVLRCPITIQPIVYMALHLALTLATLMLNLVWWKYKVANQVFLLVIFLISSWNGSTYMFEVFTRRYLAELVEKHGPLTPTPPPPPSTSNGGGEKGD